MSQQYPFKVYSASAGSGKTFTLVKKYLKVLLASNQREPYKSILAITFTNKAVGEMKTRILKMLNQFSENAILEKPSEMFLQISEELKETPEKIHAKSKKLLQSILHNYGAFDISTIDGFNHRIIRTFAHDLKLTLNFEIELDEASLLREAVDRLIAQAGTNKLLTKTLIDYAISKADDDKSWTINDDLFIMASLLTKANHYKYITTLQDKQLTDFNALQVILNNNLLKLEKEIIEHSNAVLQLIQDNDLAFSDFSSSYLPKHFKNLTELKFDINFSAKWQETITEKSLYPTKATNQSKAIIDSLQPKLADYFYKTKNLVFKHKFFKAIRKNLVPLSVLNLINQELIQLKNEKNALFISDFNTLIGNQIKNQPTPFIYERLGEKFKHYFIDEFQDTSIQQWQNLIPLIDNNLSAQTGTALLVGDAKQAIYRWRGGKAEQFIGLTSNDNPFHAEKKVESLESNYRSYKEIVNFNNSFFKHLSTVGFNNAKYSSMYANASQKYINSNSGYVELEFINFEKEDEKDELYPNAVFNKIVNCKEQGYEYSDICVLVRKNSQAATIANYLTTKNIDVASFESMLLINSPEVNAANTILKLLFEPNNKNEKINLLYYLANKYSIKNKHYFFKTHINLDNQTLFKSFEGLGIYVNTENLLELSLYELVETIIRNFKLYQDKNAYINYYLDVVYDYSLNHTSSISEFIDFFEKNEDRLNIITPEDLNAVKIMTIHKSKGLEFPVVIFPYAEQNIYKEINPKVWYPLNKSEFNNFEHVLINYNKDIAEFNETGLAIYNQHQSELELDNINLLYVTLTRPVEQLYIIGKKDMTAKGIVNTNTFSGLFINYLQKENIWQNDQLLYNYGTQKRVAANKLKKSNTEILKTFISTPKESHAITIVTNSGYIWDTEQEKAIERGNLIHKIMASIKTKDDINSVLDTFFENNIITNNQKQVLKQTILDIVNHEELKPFFTEKDTIYNECDILDTKGLILRPDRLNVTKNNTVTIIDYKTGAFQQKHKEQLSNYEAILKTMNFTIDNKILIYINDTITIEKV